MSNEKEPEQSFNKPGLKDEEENDDKEENKKNEEPDERKLNYAEEKTAKKKELDVGVAVAYDEEAEKEEKMKREHEIMHGMLKKRVKKPKGQANKGESEKDSKEKEKRKKSRSKQSKSPRARPSKRNSNHEAQKDKSTPRQKKKKDKKDKDAAAKFLGKLFVNRAGWERLVGKTSEEKASGGPSPKPKKKLKEGDDSIIASGQSIPQMENYDVADFGLGQIKEFPSHIVEITTNPPHRGKLFIDGYPFWKIRKGEKDRPEVKRKDLYSERISQIHDKKEGVKEPKELPDEYDADADLQYLAKRNKKYFEGEEIRNRTLYDIVHVECSKDQFADAVPKGYSAPVTKVEHPSERVSYCRFNFKKETVPFRKASQGAPLRRLRKTTESKSAPSSPIGGSLEPVKQESGTSVQNKSRMESLPRDN